MTKYHNPKVVGSLYKTLNEAKGTKPVPKAKPAVKKAKPAAKKAEKAD